MTLYEFSEDRILYRDLSHFESAIQKKVADKIITYFLRKFGTDITVVRSKEHTEMSDENPEPTTLADAAFDVYGEYSGLSPKTANAGDTDGTGETVTFPARIIIGTLPMSPMDAAISGHLEQQIIYTRYDVLPNDRFFINMEEGSKKEFLVGQHLVSGQHVEIIKRFEVNNLGGD